MQKTDEIDPSALDALREFEKKGGPDLVGSLTGLFLRDAATRLGALKRAVGSADAVAIERGAQSLKGSSASVGAMAMSQMCAELEEKGRSGAVEGASEILTGIEEEFSRTRAELEAKIERSPAQLSPQSD